MKPNYKIVYGSLKKMALGGIGARGDEKHQNLPTFLKRGKYLKNENFGKPKWIYVKVYFFRSESILWKLSLKTANHSVFFVFTFTIEGDILDK